MKTVCQTCKAYTKALVQCTRKTCKWSPYCFQHTQVYIKKSGIPDSGDGVFAKQDIKTKTILGDYKIGTLKLTKNDVLQTQNRSYIWKRAENEYYNGITGVLAGKFNACRPRDRPLCTLNAQINGNGKIITKKNIMKDTEIFVSYGAGYRF
jgi:hypothetical protein